MENKNNKFPSLELILFIGFTLILIFTFGTFLRQTNAQTINSIKKINTIEEHLTTLTLTQKINLILNKVNYIATTCK